MPIVERQSYGLIFTQQELGGRLDSGKFGGILMAGLAAVLIVVAVSLPRFPQPADYHNFADRRGWLGIPNFGDVASNVGFAVVGVMGLYAMLQRPSRVRFLDQKERWPYLFVFVGLVLTAAGSSYYHLAPDNARLVWDRLPMTIVFMSLVAALIAERVSVRAAIVLLPVFLAIGVESVFQWRWSELQGRGDLRFYAAVQLYAMLAVLLALFWSHDTPAEATWRFSRPSTFSRRSQKHSIPRFFQLEVL